MNPIQDETDLVSAVHDGPFEAPMWQTFLERLRARTGAGYAEIAFRLPDQPQGDVIRLYSGRAATPELARLYIEDAWQRDPLAYFELREERVYALQDLFQPGNAAHQRYRREVFMPLGIDAVRIVRVTEPGGLSAWLNITRGGTDFTPADGALLSRIVPHFRRALRAYAEIERQKRRASMAAEVMARFNFGWLRLDAKGVVLEESPEAARLLQHGAGLRRTRSGRLIADDPLTDRRLSAALRAVGGYRADLYIEDWYMMLKLTEGGAMLRTLPDPVVEYRIHTTNISANNAPMLQARLQILDLYRDHPGHAWRVALVQVEIALSTWRRSRGAALGLLIKALRSDVRIAVHPLFLGAVARLLLPTALIDWLIRRGGKSIRPGSA